MQKFSCSPLAISHSAIKHRQLLIALIKREAIGRYRGSVFGVAWSFLHPIFMLAIYTFAFSYVFKQKFYNDDSSAHFSEDSKFDFAVILFAGLILFNLFAECFSRAPSIIQNNASYVKKVVFPLEILPMAIMGATLFHMLVSLGVWLIAHFCFMGIPPWTIALTPLYLLPFILMVMGLTWLAASIGAYVRDLSQMVILIVPAMMFLSPLFFPITRLPEHLQILMILNPLSLPMENLRMVMIRGEIPAWTPFAIHTAICIFVFYFGFVFFQRIRRGFADVL